MNKNRTYYLCLPMAALLACSSATAACGTHGCALVDARWSPVVNAPSFTLVQWDGTFLDQVNGLKPGPVNTTFESRFGNDGSVPDVSVDWPPDKLNYEWAFEQVTSMLNSWPWSPTYPNGIPDPKHPPLFFTIKLDRRVHDPKDPGYYSLSVQVRNWSGLIVPVTCEVTSANISIGPVQNDKIAFATAPVSLRCNGETEYKMTVGSVNGGPLVQYANGGQLRMSFDGAGGANIVSGHADKNQPVDTAIRATTVPGTALPGKYTASAVLSVDIL